jgi:hypothetical protein
LCVVVLHAVDIMARQLSALLFMAQSL